MQRGPTVLVVEDDATLGAWLEATLAAHGYRPVRVHTAEAALEVLGEGTVPCAILLDLALPARGGLVLWRALRRAHAGLLARVPVVALSGLRRAAHVAAGTGGLRQLHEPFEARRLLELLRQHCSAGRAVS